LDSGAPLNSGAVNNRLLRDYAGTIIFAVVVALFIRFFVIEAYRIPSPAMKPTLEPGDTLFVEKWPFGLRMPWADEPFTQASKPEHGEVVVFSFEADRRRDYIKRVLALAGDTVEMRKGSFFLNGQSMEATPDKIGGCGNEKTPDNKVYPVCWEGPGAGDFASTKVPEGMIFVAGDLRTPLKDAKVVDPNDPLAEKNFGNWGMVPASSLKGRALLIWLSVDPLNRGTSTGFFPNFRFDRMLRRVH
jgi:signal peptidase I